MTRETINHWKDTEVFKRWLNGEPLQSKGSITDEWHDIDDKHGPNWGMHLEWRIKPKNIRTSVLFESGVKIDEMIDALIEKRDKGFDIDQMSISRSNEYKNYLDAIRIDLIDKKHKI